jgi:subtilase family serine protease
VIGGASKARGVYRAAVRLDPDDRVAESDETNNTASCTLVVTN